MKLVLMLYALGVWGILVVCAMLNAGPPGGSPDP